MRVLIGTAFSPHVGGLQSHIESLSQALRRRGVHADVYQGEQTTTRQKMAAVVRALGNFDMARVYLTRDVASKVATRIRRELKRERLALVSAHDVLLTGELSEEGIPIVVTVHGPLSREVAMRGKVSPQYFSYLKTTERRAYEAAQAIITVDTGQKEIIVSDFHISPEKIHVIYNGVDTDLFKPKSLVQQAEKPFFLVPRRLVPKNGVHVAIEAFCSLTDLTDISLVIAGDGPERSKLESMVPD